MQITALKNSCAYGKPGVFRGHLSFENSRLAEYQWPLCEIRGSSPGPRLCVSAGVHVNEVCSIEAAVRLQKLFDPDTIKGTVSIIPLINQPALYKYCEYECPIDGKNINHTFPGRSDGTFSEALCDAILNEWTIDADGYIDMHGGNLKEKVSKFSIFQKTDNHEFDSLARRIAMCFDAEIVLGLPPEFMKKPGRPPTAFALRRQVAIMSEAGSNGLLVEEDIAFHVEGVLNVARTLGIISTPLSVFHNARIPCNSYLWVNCPEDGEFHAEVEPGAKVQRGQTLGTVRNIFGDTLAELSAPGTGFVLWRITHPSIRKGDPVLTVVEVETGEADFNPIA